MIPKWEALVNTNEGIVRTFRKLRDNSKRGIAGSCVFTIYDRAPLLGFQEGSSYLAKATEVNISDAEDTPKQIWEYQEVARAGVEVRNARYADQIPPFDITLTAANEYGQLAIMRLYGVEFLNEGAGLSVDDIVNKRKFVDVKSYYMLETPNWAISSEGHIGNTDGNTPLRDYM